MSIDLPNRQSIRLKGFDYSSNGHYFVTICTHNRENIFGEIKNKTMVLNKNGEIVEFVLNSLPRHFFVELIKFQIMPNHVHFIVQITNVINDDGREDRGSENQQCGREDRAPTLGRIIAYFKYESTKQIVKCVGAGIFPPDFIRKNQLNLPFPKIFQRNYYEHIIKNEPEYLKICWYIENNPQMWDRDRNNLKIVGANHDSPVV